MSDFNNNISNSSGPGSAAEPSMEEILASIRRILKEDEAAPARVDIDDDVLVLDHSMQVKPVDFSTASELPPEMNLAAAHPDAPVTNYHQAHYSAEPGIFLQDAPAEPASPAAEPASYHPSQPSSYRSDYQPASPPHQETEYTNAMPEHDSVEPPEGLMSEASSSAAANSIGALIRSISTERSVAVSRGGITIEDIVREEIRPILKAWLDSHLPSLVERLVRSEIARVVDRSSI